MWQIRAALRSWQNQSINAHWLIQCEHCIQNFQCKLKADLWRCHWRENCMDIYWKQTTSWSLWKIDSSRHFSAWLYNSWCRLLTCSHWNPGTNKTRTYNRPCNWTRTWRRDYFWFGNSFNRSHYRWSSSLSCTCNSLHPFDLFIEEEQ